MPTTEPRANAKKVHLSSTVALCTIDIALCRLLQLSRPARRGPLPSGISLLPPSASDLGEQAPPLRLCSSLTLGVLQECESCMLRFATYGFRTFLLSIRILPSASDGCFPRSRSHTPLPQVRKAATAKDVCYRRFRDKVRLRL